MDKNVYCFVHEEAQTYVLSHSKGVLNFIPLLNYGSLQQFLKQAYANVSNPWHCQVQQQHI